MDAAKIQLSEEELLLVQNGGWVLTKNRIIAKVYQLFGDLSLQMENEAHTLNLPNIVLDTRPKIARGENYKGLPYVMLDYPRSFTNEAVFAIRSFFWWGNYFSITLHLKGFYKEKYMQAIGKNLYMLAENDFYISNSGDEWSHDLNDNHYHSLQGINAEGFGTICQGKPFLKIAAKLSLSHWCESDVFFGNSYRLLLQSLQD